MQLSSLCHLHKTTFIALRDGLHSDLCHPQRDDRPRLQAVPHLARLPPLHDRHGIVHKDRCSVEGMFSARHDNMYHVSTTPLSIRGLKKKKPQSRMEVPLLIAAYMHVFLPICHQKISLAATRDLEHMTREALEDELIFLDPIGSIRGDWAHSVMAIGH